jgi:hypothetical protein
MGNLVNKLSVCLNPNESQVTYSLPNETCESLKKQDAMIVRSSKNVEKNYNVKYVQKTKNK